MPTSTVENYVKQIYLQQQERGTDLLPMGQLATVMNVVPGTATAMVKTLAESGLVQYEPRGGIRLTEGGTRLALHVLRRHRIIEAFLVDVLGLDWSEVHDEAELLEHVVSDKVLDRMDALLNHPQYDPHGDPIPTSQGDIAEQSISQMIDCKAGDQAIVARVSDQDPEFLQYIERHGLIPGTQIYVTSVNTWADSIEVRLPNETAVVLGSNAAAKILVRPYSSD